MLCSYSSRTFSLSKGTFLFPHRSYAKAAAAVATSGGISALGVKKGKVGPTLEKKVIPAEMNPEKLVNYVCGSCIMNTGENVKLKHDSEYPEWLWNLRLGKPPPLSELEYDTLEYWRRVTKLGRKNILQLRKTRKF